MLFFFIKSENNGKINKSNGNRFFYYTFMSILNLYLILSTGTRSILNEIFNETIVNIIYIGLYPFFIVSVFNAISEFRKLLK